MGLERKKFFKDLPSYSRLTYAPVKTVKIGERIVGDGQPVLVIAEVGANHRGKLENAKHFIDLAADAGADVVKFQHLTHDLIAADTPIFTRWKNEKKKYPTLAEFYKPSEMPYEWTGELVAYAKKRRIIFLSTPFDTKAADVLGSAGVTAYKIASYEMTDDRLLTYIAKKGKPMLISTGMAYLEEVAHAVRVVQGAGNNQIVLMHCVSMYPPKSFADLNLQAIETLKTAFKLPVGYSDHSQPPYLAAPLAAVALGACVLERHITDKRAGGSHDDPNSLEVEEFKRMVGEIRFVEQSLSGSGIKQPVSYPGHEGDEIYDRWARRSVYATQDIPAGTLVTEEMLTTLRPVGGAEPRILKELVGKKVTRNIKARTPVNLEDFLS